MQGQLLELDRTEFGAAPPTGSQSDREHRPQQDPPGMGQIKMGKETVQFVGGDRIFFRSAVLRFPAGGP